MNAVMTQSKPKIAGLISLILISALGVSLAKLMWLVITPEKSFQIETKQVAFQSNTKKQKINYGKLIANQHLFGQVKKVVAPPKVTHQAAPVKPVAPPPVKLNLKLHGIVAYKSRSKDGFALISSNNGRQKVYVKGDEIENGVKVKKILPEKVVLDNNGKEEELRLPVKESKDKPKATARVSNPRNNSRFGRPPPPNMPSPVRNHQSSRNSPPDLANFRQQVMANPRRLMDIATPSPAIVDGDFIGFRIQPGRERKLFRQLGFRPGDIITEVNGIVLDDAGKGAMVLGELAQATSVSVKVKRGNQEIFIEHSF